MSSKPSSQPGSDLDATPDTLLPSQSPSTTDSMPLKSASSGTLQPGERPVPDYELVRRLGRGGFGEVWLARDADGLDVALKVVHLDSQGSQMEVRSLDVMKNIRHPNLVSVFRVWRLDERLIVAMELCDGSLSNRLKQTPDGLPVAELLEYLRDAAKGLDALHQKGVQHRDVKPQNLLLMQGGVKVADYGLAKVLEATAASHTGAMTAAYTAPEMIEGTVTDQSDQYSLAVTYYHLRLGRLPFLGNPHQVMFAHLHHQPDLSGLPEAEAAVLGRALAKKAGERWPSCTAFAAALLEAVHTPPPVGKKPASRPAGDSRTTRMAPRPAATRRWLWPLAASLLLLLLSLGLVSYFYGEHLVRLLAPQGQPTNPTPEAELRPLQDGALHLALGPWDMKTVRQLAFNQPPNKPDPQPEPPRPLHDGALHLALGPWDMRTVFRVALNQEPKKPDPPPVLPKTMTLDLGEGVKMEFVLIDPSTKPDRGKFRMGSSKSERDEIIKKYELKADVLDWEADHEVEITRPFYLARYPVTQEQYVKLIGKNPSWFQKGGKGAAALKDVKDQDTSRFPVEKVSWDDADAFCTELMKKHGEQTPAVLRQQNYRFALPTEAQWEYACRAGTTTPFHFGTALNGNQANCDGNCPYGTDEKGPYLERTSKMEDYPANAWGLFDMHGNVWQWCQDYYGPYQGLNAKDPLRSIRHSEECRVLRGGSWDYYAWFCRAAFRRYYAPNYRGDDVGFRVAVRLD